MRRIPVAVVIVWLAALPAFGQTSFSAVAGPDLASFPAAGDSSRQFTASISAEQLVSSERLRLFYDFDTGDYAGPGSWRFLAHSGGASYRFDLDAAKSSRLYAGGDATFRRNGESWSAADFNAVGAFANLEWHPASATLRTGYRIDLRRFSSMRSLDQAQHTGFGSVLVSFATRTTVIAEAFVGAKQYDAVSSSTEVIAVPIDTPAQAHAGGGGRWGALANATLVPVVTPGAPGSTAGQLTLYGRVAQSLANRTGLSLEISRRNVWGEVPPALVTTPVSFEDDGIYDDLFASDAVRRAITLKSIVATATELGASVVWLDKSYPSTPAFDEAGLAVDGVLRSDDTLQVQVGGVWPLLRQRTGPVSFDLLTGYEYVRHRSTSALHRYTAHTVRLAFAVGY